MALKKRRNNPPVVTKYTEFKPLLREDFEHRCVYCGIHENELGGPRLFAVEHLKPKGKFPLLRLDYTNTLYACGICNSYKGEDWPSNNPLADGKGYIDPCVVDYEHHFAIDAQFAMTGISDVGRYMAKRLRLGRRQVSKKLASRAAAEAAYQTTLNRIDRVMVLLSAVASGLPDHSNEKAALSNELVAAQKERAAIEAEWNTRWKPQVELDDYKA